MNEIARAMLYPYVPEFSCFFDYIDMLPYHEIVPVSPRGYGYDNVDVGTINKISPIGKVVTSDFEEILNDVESVIFTLYSQDTKNKIMLAAEKGKNIVCLFEVEDELEKKIIKKCNTQCLEYKNYSNIINIQIDRDNLSTKLYSFDTPILLVCGMSERTQKFDLQLSVRKCLLKMGYKVSQIGSREYSHIFSMHNFPDFMFQNNNEVDKVFYFNKFVKEIELKEKPDIIIIGIPGGIVPYDRYHHNRFGILPHIISEAISVDFSIFSMAYNDYDDDFYEFIKNYSKYRYGFEIDIFHLSNVYHDIYGDERVDGERLIMMNFNKILKKVKQCDRVLYSVMIDDDIDTIINKMIQNLSE